MNTTASHIEIGILERDRKSVVNLLESLLADEFVLYLKTRNFHWNAAGNTVAAETIAAEIGRK